MELFPGAGAGLAHPDGGVYDVHPGPGVVTISALLQVTSGAPVPSASRQASPPPVVRDLATNTQFGEQVSQFSICAKETVNNKKTL